MNIRHKSNVFGSFCTAITRLRKNFVEFQIWVPLSWFDGEFVKAQANIVSNKGSIMETSAIGTKISGHLVGTKGMEAWSNQEKRSNPLAKLVDD